MGNDLPAPPVAVIAENVPEQGAPLADAVLPLLHRYGARVAA